MRLLAVGIDTSVIAMWLGHEAVETTQIYLHADLAIKERALARTTPTGTSPGRYRPPGHPARVPRDALIMPTSTARSPCPTRLRSAKSA